MARHGRPFTAPGDGETCYARARGATDERGTSMRRWDEELGPVRAPDFPPGLAWLNVRRPLGLADLRGRLVILDFWTYC